MHGLELVVIYSLYLLKIVKDQPAWGSGVPKGIGLSNFRTRESEKPYHLSHNPYVTEQMKKHLIIVLSRAPRLYILFRFGSGHTPFWIRVQVWGGGVGRGWGDGRAEERGPVRGKKR